MYHEIDIHDSDTYTDSVLYNCYLQEGQTLLDDAVQTFPLNNEKHMRGCIDRVKEQHLKTDQYDSKYRCHFERKPDKGDYSDCLGYSCNREKNEFMYKLDEFNTYRNYPVRHGGSTITSSPGFCPENVQLFNNWTKRHDESFETYKTENNLIMNEEKIPMVSYKTCCINPNYY